MFKNYLIRKITIILIISILAISIILIKNNASNEDNIVGKNIYSTDDTGLKNNVHYQYYANMFNVKVQNKNH